MTTVLEWFGVWVAASFLLAVPIARLLHVLTCDQAEEAAKRLGGES